MVEELKNEMRKLENLIGCQGEVNVTSRAFTKELIRALEEKYKKDLKSSIRLRRLEFFHDLTENARHRQKKKVDVDEKFALSKKKEKQEEEGDDEEVKEPVKTEEKSQIETEKIVVKAEEIDEWKDLMTLAKIYYLLEHPNSKGLIWKRRITKKKSVKKFTDKDLIEWYVAQHFRLKALEEWALSRQEARKLAEESPYDCDDFLEDDESRELEDMFQLLEAQKPKKRKIGKLEKALDSRRPFRYTDETMEDWTESYSDDSEESGADELFDQVVDLSEEPDMKFDGYHAPDEREPSLEDVGEIFSTYREIPKYRNPVFEEMDETESMKDWYGLCDEALGEVKEISTEPEGRKKVAFSFVEDETSIGALKKQPRLDIITESDESDIEEEKESFQDEDYFFNETLPGRESSDSADAEFDSQSVVAVTEVSSPTTAEDAVSADSTESEAPGETISMDDDDVKQATLTTGERESPDPSDTQKDTTVSVEETDMPKVGSAEKIVSAATEDDDHTVVETTRSIEETDINLANFNKIESEPDEEAGSREIGKADEKGIDEVAAEEKDLLATADVEDGVTNQINEEPPGHTLPTITIEETDANFSADKSESFKDTDSSEIAKETMAPVEEEGIQEVGAERTLTTEEADDGTTKTISATADVEDGTINQMNNEESPGQTPPTITIEDPDANFLNGKSESFDDTDSSEIPKEIMDPSEEEGIHGVGTTKTLTAVEADDGTTNQINEESSGPSTSKMEDTNVQKESFAMDENDPNASPDSSDIPEPSLSVHVEEVVQKDINAIIEEAKFEALNEITSTLAKTDDADYENQEIEHMKVKGTRRASTKIPPRVDTLTTVVEKDKAQEIKTLEDKTDMEDTKKRRATVFDDIEVRTVEREDLSHPVLLVVKSDPLNSMQISDTRKSISETRRASLGEEIRLMIEEAKDRTASNRASEDNEEPVKSKSDSD